MCFVWKRKRQEAFLFDMNDTRQGLPLSPCVSGLCMSIVHDVNGKKFTVAKFGNKVWQQAPRKEMLWHRHCEEPLWYLQLLMNIFTMTFRKHSLVKCKISMWFTTVLFQYYLRLECNRLDEFVVVQYYVLVTLWEPNVRKVERKLKCRRLIRESENVTEGRYTNSYHWNRSSAYILWLQLKRHWAAFNKYALILPVRSFNGQGKGMRGTFIIIINSGYTTDDLVSFPRTLIEKLIATMVIASTQLQDLYMINCVTTHTSINLVKYSHTRQSSTRMEKVFKVPDKCLLKKLTRSHSENGRLFIQTR